MNGATRLDGDKIVITLPTGSAFEEWTSYVKGFAELANLLAEPDVARCLFNAGANIQWVTMLGTAVCQLEEGTLNRGIKGFK